MIAKGKRRGPQIALYLLLAIGVCLIYRRVAELSSHTFHTHAELQLPARDRAEGARTIRGAFSALQQSWQQGLGNGKSKQEDRVLVMGKMSTDNTDWVREFLPNWHCARYTMTNSSTTTSSSFRSADAFLTYIIDSYSHLPSTLISIQPYRHQWYTETLDNDILTALLQLNFTYIQEQGYVNLRCNPDPGCSPQNDGSGVAASEPLLLEEAVWRNLFGSGGEVPTLLASPSFGQFAVRRGAVLQRPWEDYVRMHAWLMGTGLGDEEKGRVMEAAWHMVFGKAPVHCPRYETCSSQLYIQEVSMAPKLGLNGGGQTPLQARAKVVEEREGFGGK